MSARTPGLLTVKRAQFGSSVFVLYGADGFPIAQTISNSSPEGMERARRGEHEANATWLAHCWNEHAAAPALLDRLADAVGTMNACADLLITMGHTKAGEAIKAVSDQCAEAMVNAVKETPQ